jgi:MFS family permease
VWPPEPAAPGAFDAPAAVDEPCPVRLAGLLALGLLIGSVNGLSRVTLPLYAAAIGAQAWQVGIVGGLGYAGLLLLALPTGAWIDRHGSRHLLLRGVVVAALLYLLMPLLHQPWQLIAGAWLLGLLLPFRTIPVHTEFLALVPRLKPTQAGWNRALNMVGMFFIGPALSAAIVAALGFAAVFQVAAAGLLGAALVGRRVLGAHSGVGQLREDHSLRSRIAAQLTLLRDQPTVRRTMAIDFMTQMTVAYFVVFALILAVRQFGFSLQAAAALVTVQGAFYVVTLFAGGALLARWSDERRYLLAFALMTAQALLFGFGRHGGALWLGAALMGLGVGVQGLTSVTRFAELMQTYGRGRVGGLTSLGPPAGGVLGAMLGGLVSQRLGTEAGFQMLALAYGLLALLQLRRLQHRAH